MVVGTVGWRPDQTSTALIAACGEAYTVASRRVGWPVGRADGGGGRQQGSLAAR